MQGQALQAGTIHKGGCGLSGLGLSPYEGNMSLFVPAAQAQHLHDAGENQAGEHITTWLGCAAPYRSKLSVVP